LFDFVGMPSTCKISEVGNIAREDWIFEGAVILTAPIYCFYKLTRKQNYLLFVMAV